MPGLWAADEHEVGALRERIWLAFGAAGVAWAVAYLLLPQHTPVSTVLDNAGGFACVVAIIAGVRIHRPARRTPWYLFAAAQACSGVGDVLWWVYADVLRTEPFPSAADVFYLVAYPMFAAGLFLLVRGRTRGPTRGRDLGGLLDAMIIAAGLGLLSWTFLMRPITADDSLGLTGQLVSLAYPLADVVLLAMLARLLTSPGARTASFRLLTAALLALLVADVGYAVLTSFSSYQGGAVDALWILSYAAWGAAALHPSMRAITDAVAVDDTHFTFRRFALLGTTTLIAPAVLAQEGLTNPAEVDWRGVTTGALVLYLLILARVWTLVRQVQDQSVQLAALANTDALTGIGNRRTWDLAVPLALAAAARSGAPVTVTILDLDRFKAFNDRHGHQAGDLLLKEATAAWKSMLRAEDLLVRYGGEEFCVLMAGSPADAALELVERLRTATPRRQSFSAGIAQWDGRETPEQLLARADAALYEAKRSGRDRVVSSPAPAATS
jgi:diguanylate cyclase (GGDEF)-like protein